MIAVITGADVPDTTYGVSPARYDEHVLAKDKVRHVGDPVAMVVAEMLHELESAFGVDEALAVAPWNDSLRARIYAQYSHIAMSQADPVQRRMLLNRANALYHSGSR